MSLVLHQKLGKGRRGRRGRERLKRRGRGRREGSGREVGGGGGEKPHVPLRLFGAPVLASLSEKPCLAVYYYYFYLMVMTLGHRHTH